MLRTNIYLEERQLKTLKHLAAEHGTSVATLVRDAVDGYIARQATDNPDWRTEFDELLGRMRGQLPDVPPEEIEADITAAREEVRAMRRAQRAASGG